MTRTKGRKAGRFSSQRAGQAQVCSRRRMDLYGFSSQWAGQAQVCSSRRMDLYGSVLSSLCEEAFAYLSWWMSWLES